MAPVLDTNQHIRHPPQRRGPHRPRPAPLRAHRPVPAARRRIRCLRIPSLQTNTPTHRRPGRLRRLGLLRPACGRHHDPGTSRPWPEPGSHSGPVDEPARRCRPGPLGPLPALVPATSSAQGWSTASDPPFLRSLLSESLPFRIPGRRAAAASAPGPPPRLAPAALMEPFPGGAGCPQRGPTCTPAAGSGGLALCGVEVEPCYVGAGSLTGAAGPHHQGPFSAHRQPGLNRPAGSLWQATPGVPELR